MNSVGGGEREAAHREVCATAGSEHSEPFFSIIVPVFNVAQYLPQCLDSILAQSYSNFELVAVDDASTDSGPAILDRFATRDSRVTVTHLTKNVGLGMARNCGMRGARAPYLLFVDSDDVLAPDALQLIAERITHSDAPDVVMFGFSRLYPDGRAVPDGRSSRLAQAQPDRADLLEILPSAWNKAYRAEFVRSGGFSFAPGFYEDVPWSYPILMSASSIVTLDRVCYLYRQRAEGSILASSGRKHLDLFRQYDQVFSYVDAHPELAQWKPRLVDRLTRHVPTVLESPGRIPRAVRREFFHAASAAFRRHRPAGYLAAGTAGAKVRLIEADNYLAFRIAQLGNRVVRRLFAHKR